jgi:RNA polymerase sigma factor (sigma-70 family)
MSGRNPSGALRDFRALLSDGRLGGLTDGQLLERFVSRNDSSAEDAFTLLVERHGPMVWGVCRRLLPDRSAAADAFQATFLVLVCRASVVRGGDSLGPWLYGVSRRVAARERATSLRRRERENGGVEAVAGPDRDPGRDERLAILDEEIGRLPERQRAPVVLCDLEGLPHEEAARRLGCPVGTVESRLARGRQRLRDRLVRRGFAPSAVAIWAEMACEVSALIPTALLEHPARYVTSFPAAGGMPVAVTALAQGVIQMMWLARLKPLVAVAAALVIAAAGVSVRGLLQPTFAGAQEQAKTAPPSTSGAADQGMEANRAIARKQLALLDEAWTLMHSLAQNARIDIATAPFGLWGRRRLEALHRAGAGKAEIVASLEKYINRLKELEVIAIAQEEAARATPLGVYEIRFLLMEAEIWMNEESAR